MPLPIYSCCGPITIKTFTCMFALTFPLSEWLFTLSLPLLSLSLMLLSLAVPLQYKERKTSKNRTKIFSPMYRRSSTYLRLILEIHYSEEQLKEKRNAHTQRQKRIIREINWKLWIYANCINSLLVLAVIIFEWNAQLENRREEESEKDNFSLSHVWIITRTRTYNSMRWWKCPCKLCHSHSIIVQKATVTFVVAGWNFLNFILIWHKNHFNKHLLMNAWHAFQYHMIIMKFDRWETIQRYFEWNGKCLCIKKQ